jgi:hypothetical protein
MRGCEACAATWRRWQELDRRFEAAPALAAPVGLVSAVMARVGQAEVVRQRRRQFAVWFGLIAAAAVLLTALVAFVVTGWPLQAPDWAVATGTGLISAAGFIFRTGATVVATAGAPTVAAIVGALLCLTCVLGVVWLWVVSYVAPGRRVTVAV